MRAVKIIATGKHLPGSPVSVAEICKRHNLADPGFGGERYLAENDNLPKMGAIAAQEAMDKANLKISDIDALIDVSSSISQFIPSNAALILQEMGYENAGIAAFDIHSTCLSFLAGLDTISYLVDSGRYKNVILVASEISRSALKQNEHAPLFGDAAAAVIISKSSKNESSSIHCSRIETYPVGAKDTEIRFGKRYPKGSPKFIMNGQKVYKLASKLINPFINRLLEGRNISDYDLVIPHQASEQALQIMQRKLSVEKSRFYNFFESHGNTVAASIPLGIHNAVEEGRITRGDKVLLLGTSAGFSIGGLGLTY